MLPTIPTFAAVDGRKRSSTGLVAHAQAPTSTAGRPFRISWYFSEDQKRRPLKRRGRERIYFLQLSPGWRPLRTQGCQRLHTSSTDRFYKNLKRQSLARNRPVRC